MQIEIYTIPFGPPPLANLPISPTRISFPPCPCQLTDYLWSKYFATWIIVHYECRFFFVQDHFQSIDTYLRSRVKLDNKKVMTPAVFLPRPCQFNNPNVPLRNYQNFIHSYRNKGLIFVYSMIYTWDYIRKRGLKLIKFCSIHSNLVFLLELWVFFVLAFVPSVQIFGCLKIFTLHKFAHLLYYRFH